MEAPAAPAGRGPSRPDSPPGVGPNTLSEVFPRFIRHFSPAVLGAAAVVFWIARLSVGSWSVWDFLVAATLIALWPIQEWMLHVHILHFRPRMVGGRRIDLLAGRKHREHHRNPHNLDILFILKRVVAGGVIVIPLFFFLILPGTPLALTACAIYFTFALNYEWHHFLIHTPYRPRGRRFRRIWENHRMHHFRNENFWFGVSMLMGDRILGTAPNRQDVPLSDTCYTLGQEDSLGGC